MGAIRGHEYADLLPLLNSRAVHLLEHDRLLLQLTSLERRTSRAGNDSIDHAPGSHDDIANAVAGALVTTYKEPGVKNFNRKLAHPQLGIVGMSDQMKRTLMAGAALTIAILLWIYFSFLN